MFETILSQHGIYLVAKDSFGRFLYCTENVAENFGLESPGCAVGKDDFNFFPEDRAHFYRQCDARVLAGHPYHNGYECHPTEKGIFHMRVSKMILYNAAGRERGVAISFREAAEQPTELQLVCDPETGRYHFPLDPSSWLTPREHEVFGCLLKGYFSSKVIGAQLNISYRTVEHHIEHIRQKMQCTSKYLIVESAMQLGLVN